LAPKEGGKRDPEEQKTNLTTKREGKAIILYYS